MSDILYKPGASLEIKNKVKDSKFLGSIAPVSNKQGVNKFIEQIKDKYDDATHNVSAYKLGSGDQALTHADDDGEPAGSSGPPVLQAIEGENLTGTVIVVTRYFGGTKLGIGGLIRAYDETARMAISEAGKIEIKKIYRVSAFVDYQLLGTVHGQIEAYRGQILETNYSNKGGEITFLLKPEQFQPLCHTLSEKTAGKARIRKLEEIYN